MKISVLVFGYYHQSLEIIKSDKNGYTRSQLESLLYCVVHSGGALDVLKSMGLIAYQPFYNKGRNVTDKRHFNSLNALPKRGYYFCFTTHVFSSPDNKKHQTRWEVRLHCPINFHYWKNETIM
jgi:hypothetical protein